MQGLEGDNDIGNRIGRSGEAEGGGHLVVAQVLCGISGGESGAETFEKRGAGGAGGDVRDAGKDGAGVGVSARREAFRAAEATGGRLRAAPHDEQGRGLEEDVDQGVGAARDRVRLLRQAGFDEAGPGGEGLGGAGARCQTALGDAFFGGPVGRAMEFPSEIGRRETALDFCRRRHDVISIIAPGRPWSGAAAGRRRGLHPVR